MKQYIKINEALAKCGGNERVWAVDRHRQRSNGEKYIGKSFLVGTLREIYTAMRVFGRPNTYEIIKFNEPVKLYLDLEMKVNDVLTEDSATYLTQMLIMIIRKHLMRSFPNISSHDIENDNVLHACNTSKYSIHYTNPAVVFDNSQCSLFSYVIELICFVQSSLKAILQKSVVGPTGLLCKEIIVKALESDLVDISVYRSNQQYRLIGNTKLDQNRPLRLIENPFNIHFDPKEWTFNQLCGNIDLLHRTMCTAIPEQFENFLIVPPHPRLPHLSIHYMQKKIYSSSLSDLRDDMHIDGREFYHIESLENILIDNLKVFENVNIQKLSMNNSPTALLDDDTHVFTDTGTSLKARNLSENMIVFCPHCETKVHRPPSRYALWTRVEGQGTPSARVILKPNNDRLIHCFNCNITTIILETGDQYGFVPSPDQIIRTDYPKLNWEGRQDVDFDIGGKLFFLDAPMGSGKTHVAEQYLLKHPHNTVLAITFRISLAKYLSNRLKLACYLDNGFWKDDKITKAHHRCVICLDSLYRHTVPQVYDIVLLDEGTFIQYHFLSGTITTKLEDVVQAFKYFLTTAKKVIVMQHRIPDTTIAFYSNIMNIPYGSPLIVCRKFIQPVKLHPMKKVDRSDTLITIIINDYLANFNSIDNKSSMPGIIFTTRADHAMMLLWMLKHVANDHYGHEASERIRGIWGSVQDDDWCTNFLSDPNTYCQDCDLLIVTSVLQAGHSIDHHFRISYDFLFLGVLTYREEIQFISRLRYLGRDNMTDWKYAWIQPGTSNSKLASFSRIKYTIEELTGVAEATTFLSNTLAAVRSERYDTMNRHVHLHVQEYRLSDVAIQELTFESTNIHYAYIDRYNLEWVKIMTAKWMLKKGKTVKRFFMNYEDYDGDLDEILAENELSSMRSLLALHLGAMDKNIINHIKCGNIVKGRKVLAEILELSTPNNVATSLSPFYNLSWFLDYALFIRSPNNEGEDKRFWMLRLQSTKKQIAGLHCSELVKLLCDLLQAAGADNEYILHYNTWRPTKKLSPEIYWNICSNYQATYEYFREQKITSQQSRMENSARVTPNSEISIFMRKIGLSLQFIRYNGKFKNIEKSLCIIKCILEEDHYNRYRPLIAPTIWQNTENMFLSI